LLLDAQRIDQIDHPYGIKYSRHEPKHEASEITLSTSSFLLRQQENEILSFLELLQQTISHSFESLDTEEADKAIFYMSIAMSLTRIYQSAPDNGAMYYFYRAFRGFASPCKDTLDPQAWRREATRNYINAFQTSDVRQLFVTSTGIVGLSRDEVQPGDWLCQLQCVHAGCSWLLRKTEEGCYRIVSIAYTFPNDLSGFQAQLERLYISSCYSPGKSLYQHAFTLIGRLDPVTLMHDTD
jgi:hypothetical protein